MTTRRKLILFAAAGLLLAGLPTSGAAQSVQEATVVYVLRHAERAADDPVDPILTPEGSARAELLARTIGGEGIQHLYSTAYKRTRLTLAPLAARLMLPVEDYQPTAVGMKELADRIRGAKGRHVVVGHSNTVREFVTALGGDGGAPIGENENDRLYVVTIAADGSVSTVLRRY